MQETTLRSGTVKLEPQSGKRAPEPQARPRPARHLAALVGILVLAAVYRFAIFLLEPYPQRPPFTSDSGQYYGFAEDLAQGVDYTLGDHQRAAARSLLPPLYPLFLASFLSTVGFQPVLVFGVQILLSVLVVGATYWLARRVLGAGASLLAAGLVAASPAMALEPNRVLTEAIYTPLLVLTVVLFCAACDRKRLGWAFAAGLFCGGTMLARNVAILLPLVLCGSFAATQPVGRAVRLSLSLLLGCAVAVAPWVAYRYVGYGGVGTGNLRQGLGMLTSYAVMAHYGLVVRPERVPFPYDDPQAAHKLYMEKVWKPLHTPGYVPPVTASYFLSHPGDYCRQSFWRAFQLLMPESCGKAFGIQAGFRECLHSAHYGQLALKMLLLAFDTLLLLGAAAGILLSLRHWKALVPLYAVGGYFLALHVLVHATTRYRYPLIPLLAVFAALFYANMARWISRKRRLVAQSTNC